MVNINGIGGGVHLPEDRLDVGGAGAVSAPQGPAPSAPLTGAVESAPAAPGSEGAAARVGDHRLEGQIQQSRLNEPAATPMDRFHAGAEQFRNRQYGEARNTFQNLLQDPSTPAAARPQLHYDLGQSNLRLGNLREACDNFRAMRDDPASSPRERDMASQQLRETHQHMLDEGLERYRRGDFEGARQRFQELRGEPGLSAQTQQALDHNLQMVDIGRRQDELMQDQLNQIITD